jgi:hypothetical protein
MLVIGGKTISRTRVSIQNSGRSRSQADIDILLTYLDDLEKEWRDWEPPLLATPENDWNSIGEGGHQRRQHFHRDQWN